MIHDLEKLNAPQRVELSLYCLNAMMPIFRKLEPNEPIPSALLKSIELHWLDNQSPSAIRKNINEMITYLNADSATVAEACMSLGFSFVNRTGVDIQFIVDSCLKLFNDKGLMQSLIETKIDRILEKQ